MEVVGIPTTVPEMLAPRTDGAAGIVCAAGADVVGLVGE